MKIVFATASQLAQMIRERKLSSSEIVQAYLKQIAQHNPRINAIATLDAEQAIQKAKAADEALAKGEHWGALHGVPITVKDTFETAGLRTTAGYKPLANYVPQQDATAVARLRQAGAIILGKSNLAEMASDFQSTNPLFGRVKNPWNVNYTAGGSSGGSAAAISAGFSALELGNDASGSTRQPAHCCGVYALKPTDRRISTAGHIPEAPGKPKCIRQLMTVGLLARSIEDLRLCFSLTAGTDSRQPGIPPVPLENTEKIDLSQLRIVWSDTWQPLTVDSEIKRAINLAVKKLELLCHSIEKWESPPFDLAEGFQVCNQLTALNFIYSQSASFEDTQKVLIPMWREATQGEKKLRKMSNFSHFLPTLLNPSLKKYFQLLTKQDRLITQMDRAFAPWDIWLCPVAMTIAFTHRPKGTVIEIEGRKVPYFLANGGYTMLFNLTGHPTMVIPIEKTTMGLPIGIQIVGKRWRDLQLLAIANIINRVIGNFQHPVLSNL